jgi:signal transduction histidine kinase
MREEEALTLFEERYHRFEKLGEIFTWLVVVFGVLFIQLPLEPKPDRIVIFFVAFSVAIFSILWHRLIRLPISGLTKNFLESIVDVVAIFFVVRASGGVGSYLTFLYILPNLDTAFCGSRRNMIIMLILSTIFIFLEFILFGRPNPFGFYFSILLVFSLYLAILYGRFLSQEIVLAQKRREELKIEKIKEIARLKDEFVYIVSHELRTPIAGIRGFLELIVLGEEGTLSATVRSLVGAALIKVEELGRLVSNLLDLSRIESARLQFNLQNHSLAELVSHYAAKLNLLFNDKRVNLVIRPIDPDLEVFTDKDYFGEVLSNLLTNGLGMSPYSGKVELSAGRLDDSVWIKVKDFGCGFEKKELEHIFEKFYQPKEKKGGGLDLFVTRKLVEKMGGEIQVESKKGEGSCFTFSLPIAQHPVVEAIMPKGVIGQVAPKRDFAL